MISFCSSNIYKVVTFDVLMEKLPLELLLECGIKNLGSGLGRREYFEEIAVGALIDNLFTGFSAEKAERIKKEIGGVEGAIVSLASCPLTENQLLAAYSPFLMFRRRSGVCKGFLVEYNVFSTIRLREYESVVDESIRSGSVDHETVYIKSADCSRLEVDLCISGGIKSQKRVEVISDMRLLESDLFSRLFKIRLLDLVALDKERYNPDQVSKAIFNLLESN